ncbi:MAG: GreA/GreB family elongation factor [Bacilli bacterium]|jgi:transcription elongation factor GreA|nr:GreA/GreB family elongation factor [Bacilli bacterium]
MNLTKSSFEILKQRLAAAQELNKEIVKEIEEARAQGDLSENADYSAAMEKKKANDALIAEYQREINSAIIVTDEIDTSKVNINSVVTVLRIKDNIVKVYTIGDAISTNPDAGIVSEKSPIGRALMGHVVDDIVSVETAHPYQVKIVKISATRD